MLTIIEKAAQDPEYIRELMSPISHFVAENNNESKIRLSLFTMISTVKHDLAWKNISERFLSLFPNTNYSIKSFNKENTIKRFITEAHKSNNDNLGGYIAIFWANEISKAEAKKTTAQIQGNTAETTIIAKKIERFIETRSLAHLKGGLDQNSIDQLTTTISSGLHDSLDSRKTHEFFFSHSSLWDEKGTADTSYYVLYRFSTIREEIVKTFLAIKPPTPLGAQCFSFTHVYPVRTTNSKRITRGPVLAYDQAVHFIGGSVTLRYTRASNKIQGIKLMALPFLNNTFRLCAGVFLSHNLSWLPIIGRIAFVHLGYKSDLDSNISDTDVDIKVLSNEVDLIRDIELLNEKFNLFKQHEEVAETCDWVLKSITNRPFVDRELSLEKIARRAISAEDGRDPYD